MTRRSGAGNEWVAAFFSRLDARIERGARELSGGVVLIPEEPIAIGELLADLVPAAILKVAVEDYADGDPTPDDLASAASDHLPGSHLLTLEWLSGGPTSWSNSVGVLEPRGSRRGYLDFTHDPDDDQPWEVVAAVEPRTGEALYSCLVDFLANPSAYGIDMRSAIPHGFELSDPRRVPQKALQELVLRILEREDDFGDVLNLLTDPDSRPLGWRPLRSRTSAPRLERIRSIVDAEGSASLSPGDKTVTARAYLDATLVIRKDPA